ncbi:MAG: hypothetical protein GVY20_08150 [Bacteroidetes bacterium]|nr:hypothetical protein [Bacteroidota bacterium]
MSTEERNEKKKEEIIEKAQTIIPDNFLPTFREQLDEIPETVNEEAYLDTFNVNMDALIDSVSKYSDLNDFKNIISERYRAMSNDMAKKGLSMKQIPCNNHYGLGFARSVEMYGSLSTGIAAAVAVQLSGKGGGGVDYIYDFVNMDRGVYTYTFCGLGVGAGVGAGAEVLTGNVGFSGLRKWLWNIDQSHAEIRNRFEGPIRAYALGISGSLYAALGLEVGASVGFGHELDWDGTLAPWQNFIPCPKAFSGNKRGGVKEAVFSASISGGGGAAVEVEALFEAEVVAIFRTMIDHEKAYSVYSGNSGSSRYISSLKMAKELIIPEPLEYLTTGSAPIAAATVLILGAFNPSECPPPKQVPEIGNSEIVSIEERNITARVNVSDDGGSQVTERGVCWSQEEPPTLEHNCMSEGSGNGEFTSNITDLNPDTEYYARAYAENEVGVGYGELLDFRTKPIITKPTVETASISSISANTAVSGGNITNDGKAKVTTRGVCWSTSENPTLNDSCSDDGDGVGNFTSDITSLFPNTRYYVRAYATNSAGTGYGNQRNFVTDEGIDDVPPEVNDFLTTEDIEILEDEGLKIYKGLNPPNIEGNYYADSQEQENGNLVFMDYSYKFSNQTSDLKIELNYQSENEQDIGEGFGAFIAGSGQTFSVYLETQGRIEEDTHTVIFNTASIYSGSKSPDGIKNFQHGFIVTHKENDKNNNYMNVGDSRVIYETDNLAEEIDSYPHSAASFKQIKNLLLNMEIE